MSEEQKQNMNQEATNNAYYTSATALQIRLNVEPLMNQLELDIRGLRETWDEDKQEMQIKRVSEPLFVTTKTTFNAETKKKETKTESNEKGVHMYMAFVRSVLNTQVVQGNLKEDDYTNMLYRIRRRLAHDLIINRINWGLKTQNYNYVIDLAMNLVELFLSRLIGNKERESYANTFKTVESSNTLASSKGWFK